MRYIISFCLCTFILSSSYASFFEGKKRTIQLNITNTTSEKLYFVGQQFGLGNDVGLEPNPVKKIVSVDPQKSVTTGAEYGGFGAKHLTLKLSPTPIDQTKASTNNKAMPWIIKCGDKLFQGWNCSVNEGVAQCTKSHLTTTCNINLNPKAKSN